MQTISRTKWQSNEKIKSKKTEEQTSYDSPAKIFCNEVLGLTTLSQACKETVAKLKLTLSSDPDEDEDALFDRDGNGMLC